MRGLALGVALAVMAGNAVAQTPDLHKLAEDTVRNGLVDPDSAEFRTEGDATAPWVKHGLFGKRIEGPVAVVCGQAAAIERLTEVLADHFA